MATAPCDLCHESTFGRLLGFYPAVLLDSTRYSRKLKACSVCVEQFVTGHGDELFDALTIAKTKNTQGCFACGQLPLDADRLQVFYLTAFGESNRRYDYQSRYCRTCASSLIHDLGLTNAG